MHGKSRALVLLLAVAWLPPLCQSQRTRPDPAPHQPAAAGPQDRVDLNHASIEQLLKVPGITRTWAERIVRFRPYRSKQDLADQGILPGEVYSRIRDYVVAHRAKD